MVKIVNILNFQVIEGSAGWQVFEAWKSENIFIRLRGLPIG
jgi:hypothetical protein